MQTPCNSFLEGFKNQVHLNPYRIANACSIRNQTDPSKISHNKSRVICFNIDQMVVIVFHVCWILTSCSFVYCWLKTAPARAFLRTTVFPRRRLEVGTVRTEPEAAVKTKPKNHDQIRGNYMIESVSTSRCGESDGADGVRNNNR